MRQALSDHRARPAEQRRVPQSSRGGRPADRTREKNARAKDPATRPRSPLQYRESCSSFARLMEDSAELSSVRSGGHPDSLGSAELPDADTRVVEAWRGWLEVLGTDAEAALAASMAYRQLDAAGRERWLAAVDQEVERVHVPRIALYAPLLAVEADPERRSAILRSLGPAEASATPRASARGLRGCSSGGLQVAAIVTPLYLDFAQVLACGYRVGEGIEWVRHDPIVNRHKTPRPGEKIGGVALESTTLKVLVDELAHAIVAHSRSGKSIPEALRAFADLFGSRSWPESHTSVGEGSLAER